MCIECVAVEEVVGGFVIFECGEFLHAGFFEEGVGFGHGGEGFGVACRAIVEDAVDEDRGEA